MSLIKTVDFDTIVSVNNSGSNSELMNSFLRIYNPNYNVIKEKISLAPEEISDFVVLVNKLAETKQLTMNQKNGYILGYQANSGIREQFDILRFSEKSILNIELKSKLPKNGLPEIKNQLIRHKLLLGLTEKKVDLVTFVKEEMKIYKLSNTQDIEEITPLDLISMITDTYLATDILAEVDLSTMIVSPYVNPEKFVNHEYFLTDEQIQVRGRILKCKNNKMALIGGAGTGKTLLLLDLAKKYLKMNKQVILVFAGSLENNSELESLFKFPVRQVNQVSEQELSTFDVILVDESQSLYKEAFDKLYNISEQTILFSVDQQQTLHPIQKKLNIQKKLTEDVNVTEFKLRNKVRTDPVMSSFISKFLDLKDRTAQPFNFQNVKAVYFDSKELARDYLENLVKSDDYKSIELTPYTTKSTYNIKRAKTYIGSKTVHHVIGREYDNVVVPLDEHYFYNADAKLDSNYPGYYPFLQDNSIFEAISRVKKHLVIVVINNPSLFIKIQEILTWQIDKVIGEKSNGKD